MQKADPNSPKLTENDKDVLRKIIDHSRIPDSKIADDIGISPQAVFKIRAKLEQLGIIKGYTPIIDFKKIGIRILAFLVIRLKPEVWSKYSDELVSIARGQLDSSKRRLEGMMRGIKTIPDLKSLGYLSALREILNFDVLPGIILPGPDRDGKAILEFASNRLAHYGLAL